MKKSFQTRVLVFCWVVVFPVIISGCISGQNQLLSATFNKSSPIVRAWAEACISNNMSEAYKYLSLGAIQQPDVCTYLAEHENRNSFSVIAIEDRSSLISSGQLLIVVKDQSINARAIFLIFLANTEQGPVVYHTHFCSMDNQYWDLRGPALSYCNQVKNPTLDQWSNITVWHRD